MTEGDGRRVALLARPGAACERLREALQAAGAQRVLEADPTALEPAELSAAGAQVVVVALDAATEDALDRFDDVLGNPAIDVIYEEADLAAARDGWDVARWQRHLVAKLRGNGSVLPPGPVGGNVEAAIVEPATAEPAAAAPAVAGVDEAVATAEPPPSPPSTVAKAELAQDAPTYNANAFDPVNAEFSDFGDAASPPAAPGDDFGLAELEGGNTAAPAAAAGEFESGFDATLGEAVADTFAPIDAGTGEPDVDEAAATEPTVADPAAPPAAGFGELSLDDGTGGATALDSDETADRFRHDLVDLERRISSLELVDDTPQRGPEQARGAVLVLAGLGGPDAVRQLLGALPAGFARPVLVQQRLDGGRYDKLVAQMQRATQLPVTLAVPGQPAEIGSVYILPADVGLEDGDDGLRFNKSGGDVLAALPAADSAVLLLSGSDPAVVDAIMNHNWSGALVAGQAADGCYDPVAANALAARGGDTGQPVELATRLVERWSGADKP